MVWWTRKVWPSAVSIARWANGPFELAPHDLAFEPVLDALELAQAHPLGAHEHHRIGPGGEPARVRGAHRPERGHGLERAVGGLADPPAQHVVLADEGRDERRARRVVEPVGAIDLLDAALRHDRDPVRHRQRFALVVGDVDEGDADLALDLAQFGAHVLAELEVERRERLVEQQHGRLDREGAGDRDPLALAAGQLGRFFVALAGERDELEQLIRALAAFALGDAATFEAEADVLPDAHQREQREILEDQRRRAAIRADAAGRLRADQDRAAAGLEEARDHPEDRGLAAAGRPEDREELAGLDLQVGRLDRGELAKAHRDVAKLNVLAAHRAALAAKWNGPPVRGRPVAGQALVIFSTYSLRIGANHGVSACHHQRFCITSGV